MKKTEYIKQLFALSLIGVLILTACKQEPIFWAITQEIKLEKSNVSGNVHSIVKLKSSLYTCNGTIYTKGLNSIRGWNDSAKPDGLVVALASDAAYLYALTAAEGKNYQVWFSTGSGAWERVIGASGELVVLFDNGVNGDAPENTTGRNAYVRVAGKVKKLNGGAALTDIAVNGVNENTVAAANVGGTDYFAATKAFCSDGTNLYCAKGAKVQKGTTNENLADTSVEAASPKSYVYVSSPAKKIIVGTSNGIQEILLDTSGVPVSVQKPGANGVAALGDRIILGLASFGSADNFAIYAGAAQEKKSSYNALWAYYPSRGNWNYE